MLTVHLSAQFLSIQPQTAVNTQHWLQLCWSHLNTLESTPHPTAFEVFQLLHCHQPISGYHDQCHYCSQLMNERHDASIKIIVNENISMFKRKSLVHYFSTLPVLSDSVEAVNKMDKCCHASIYTSFEKISPVIIMNVLYYLHNIYFNTISAISTHYLSLPYAINALYIYNTPIQQLHVGRSKWWQRCNTSKRYANWVSLLMWWSLYYIATENYTN